MNTEFFKNVSGIQTRKAAGVGYWFKEKLTLVTMFVQNANSIPMIGKFLKNLYHQQTFWGRGPEYILMKSRGNGTQRYTKAYRKIIRSTCSKTVLKYYIYLLLFCVQIVLM